MAYNFPMSIRGAFLHNGYHLYPGHIHFMDRLSEALSTFGVAMDRISSTEILYRFTNDGEIKAKDLPYDFIVVLDKDKYILKALSSNGIRLFDSASSVESCDDKLLTFFALQGQGIPMPKTIGVPLNYVNGDASDFLKEAAKELGYPIVVKTNFGSMGTGVYLARDFAELSSLEQKLCSSSHLLQEFIPTSFGHDTRVICLGGKVIAAYRRENTKGDFRSNIALGGIGTPIALSKKAQEVAEKAASILGLDYCGIDLLDGPNGPILCEVNSNAFFAEAEKVTGVDIAGAYAAYIVNHL